MSILASQITGNSTVCSTVFVHTNNRVFIKAPYYRSFVVWLAASLHKGSVIRKVFHVMTSSWMLTVWRNNDPIHDQARPGSSPCAWPRHHHWWLLHAFCCPIEQQQIIELKVHNGHIPDSKVHEAYMEPTWGQQDPGGPHVGPMNLAIRDTLDWKITLPSLLLHVFLFSPFMFYTYDSYCSLCHMI